METINHNGAVYTKASLLAKRYHNTTDYIGQLCRNHKVAAELVGRTWFVSEESLLSHRIVKKKEVRPHEILSKNAVEIQSAVAGVPVKINVHAAVSKKTHRQFFVNELPAPVEHHWQNRTVAYVDDAATLVPQVTNKIRKTIVEATPKDQAAPRVVPIHLAESEKLTVRDMSGARKHPLQFTELPEIALAGDLNIVDLDTESDFVDSDPVVMADLAPEPERVRPGVVLRYHAAAPTVRPAAFESKLLQQEMRAVASSNRTGVAVVPEPLRPVAALSGVRPTPRRNRLFLPVLIIFALGVASLLVAVSSTLQSDGTTVRSSFSFQDAPFAAALVYLSTQW